MHIPTNPANVKLKIFIQMKTGIIEIYNGYMTIVVECEVANSGVGARLEEDGWSMTTNGHVENDEWFCIYTKSI